MTMSVWVRNGADEGRANRRFVIDHIPPRNAHSGRQAGWQDLTTKARPTVRCYGAVVLTTLF